MADTLRTRLTRTTLDTADSAATVTAAAAAGLTTYRALHGRPAETRTTLALAAGTLAAVLTDHHVYKALAPLRRRLGAEHHSPVREPAPAPTPEQLAADLCADAAQRAAYGASRLDYGGGALTKADNWTGHPDGTATCAITPGAHLLSIPGPADQGGHGRRTYLLVQEGVQPIEVDSIGELVGLLANATAGLPRGGAAADDLFVAVGRDLAIAELCPDNAVTDAPVEENDQANADADQEAAAHANGTL
ncbi:hypothetical protein [Kitasatospora sp. NPDC085879]|uniref:hypothetical protein n=1 Tax=Kitasatospora sp. NPDC085879 TaxID=3154769 RepID=UPI00341C29A9